MNNDLEQFSEERLIELAEMFESKALGFPASHAESAALARIALSAKQAKPVGYFRKMPNASYYQLSKSTVGMDQIPLYTTPQPAHTEQNEMLNKASSLSESIGELRKQIDSSGGYDFEALRSEQMNSPVIPDGWKLVPIAPTQEMVDACFEATSAGGIQKGYRAMLAAAPKPESE